MTDRGFPAGGRDLSTVIRGTIQRLASSLRRNADSGNVKKEAIDMAKKIASAVKSTK